MNTTHQKNGLDAPVADQKKALARYAAVCWVNERVSKQNPDGRALQTTTIEASQKLWEGYHFSAGSIERYYYMYRKDGFPALLPAGRSDKGRTRVISAEIQEKLLDARRQHSGMDITTLVRHLADTGVLEPGAFSLSSVYRLFATYGLDRRSLKAGCLHSDSGPQKAFEMAMPNMLWMADMMYGPTIVTKAGKAIRTRLFALLDDHSRLCPCAQYFGGEGSECFMAVLREALRRRGLPDKIYTDNGKVFLCRHLIIVCANLNIKLSRARPYAAWSKAKAESAVQIIEREVLAPMRNQTFFSLAELNRAIRSRIEEVNRRRFQKLEVSRYDLYIEIDKPALKPLPSARYEYAEFHKARVNIDYHIEVQGHYYSVPYELKGEQLDVRLSARTVEALHKGRRVTAHPRDDSKGRHTTDPAHMPRAHREHLDWTPSRIIHWAGTLGPHCAQAVEQIIASRPHPEQGYRAALGIIRLAKGYATARVDAACHRTLALDVCRYQSIKSILKSGKDKEPLFSESPAISSYHNLHPNFRGSEYYAEQLSAERQVSQC